jgi:hypothetical protein
MKMSDTPSAFTSTPATLGQHTRSILIAADGLEWQQ